MTRVRSGDRDAAAELVRRFEPVLRSRVRFWLRQQDPRLRRLFDSMDICQSVLGSFFVRAARGQYDLGCPEQLVGLLTQMARFKLGHQIEHHQAARRDLRRTADAEPETLTRPEPGPASEVARRELLEELRRRLTETERLIIDRRADGQDWARIADELGGTPDGRRVQFARALDRVVTELGLSEPRP